MYCVSVVNSVLDFPVVFLNGLTMLVILGVVGVSLVMGRFLVIEYAPWVGAHSKTLSDLLDVELDLIEATIDIVSLVIQVVVGVVDVLSGHTPHLHIPTWHKNVIDPSALVSLTHELSYRCAAYDDFSQVVLKTTQTFGSPLVCPILRHTYPSTGLFATLTAMFGWLSFDPTPSPFGGNCIAPYGDRTDMACVAFGSGYIVLELILPLYIVLLVGQTGLWTNLIGLGVSVCIGVATAMHSLISRHPSL